MTTKINPEALAIALVEKLGGDKSTYDQAIAEFLATHKSKAVHAAPEAEHRCLARVWNGGTGGQCMKRRCTDSEFCKSHGKVQDKKCSHCSKGGSVVIHHFAWEHHGRCDLEAPGHFTKCCEIKSPVQKPAEEKKPVVQKPAEEKKPVVQKPTEEKKPEVVVSPNNPGSDEEQDEPDAGDSLEIIEIDGEEFVFNPENNKYYDKAQWDSDGTLKYVGELDDDDMED